MMRSGAIAAIVLSVLSLLALFGTDGRLRLQVDTSVDALLTTQSPDVESRATLLGLLEVPDALDAQDVRALARAARAIRRVSGVMDVETPATASRPTIIGDDIINASLHDQVRGAPDSANALIAAAVSDPLLAGRLFSRDGRAAVVAVRLSAMSAEESLEAAKAVRDTFHAALPPDGRRRVLFTGAPLVKEQLAQLVRENLSTVMSLAMLVAPLVLAIGFRGVINMALPLVTVAAALLWTLAAMVLTGIPINLVTAIVLPLAMALTLGYSIHAMSAFSETRRPVRALRFLTPPLVLSGLTTIAGLLALTLQPLTAIRQFGFASSMGVALGLLAVATVLCPVALWRNRPVEKRESLQSRLDRVASVNDRDSPERRTRIIWGAAALVVAGLIGSLFITPSTHYVRDLPLEHPVRQDFENVNRALGGANTFDVVLTGAGPDAVLLPAVLQAADELQDWLDARPAIGGTVSLNDFLKRINQVMNGGAPEDYRLPDSLATTKQLLIIAAPPGIYQYTDLDFTHLVIRIRTPLDATADLAGLFDEIEERFEALPDGVNAALRGDLVNLTRTVEELTAGQVVSVGLAFVVIYFVLAGVFSSFSAALRALLPNAVPVALFYGIVGFAGIPLGPTTALVTCIVFGIAVDDTLFYLVHFSRAARRVADEQLASRLTLREVIGPVTMTTVILCLSFLTLVSSPFHSQGVFAVMAALTLAIAWCCDLFLTPAVAANSGIVTLWDVLRLDLGKNPERTIPLFQGMTPRQARIFALLSRIQTVPAGERFIQEGDSGQEMYVVVEGEALASLDRNGAQVELSRFRRGDTFGEAASLNRKRTADVTAVDEARLLVFNAEDLERLRRRYPRIAALAFRNLNRMQSDRLARTTRRLTDAMHQTGQFPANT